MWLVTGERRGIPFQERHPDEQTALARHYELGDDPRFGVENPMTFEAGECDSCGRIVHVDDLAHVSACSLHDEGSFCGDCCGVSA